MPETGEIVKLLPGVHDFRVETARDYRSLYTMDSMLDDVAEDSRAMEILRQEVPAAYGMAMSGDVESLSMTFRELAAMPFFHCPAPAVKAAVEKLSRLCPEEK